MRLRLIMYNTVHVTCLKYLVEAYMSQIKRFSKLRVFSYLILISDDRNDVLERVLVIVNVDVIFVRILVTKLKRGLPF